MNTLIIAASNTKDSINLDLSRKISFLGNFDLLELRDYTNIPILSKDLIDQKQIPEEISLIYEKILQYTKIIIVTPEHNGYYSAFFKNILDWLSIVEKLFFNGKEITLIVASPGSKGGYSLRKFATETLSFTGASKISTLGFPNYTPDKDVSEEIEKLVQDNE